MIGILIAATLLAPSAVAAQSEEKGAGQNWPGFRGERAGGTSEGSSTPVSWSVADSRNIKWAVPIPGLAHSCPVIWGDRVFVTTAVSGRKDPPLKVGLYGSIDPVEDDTVHRWEVYCLDRNSGKVQWTRTACTGVPKVKRHPKSSHANATPATDGTHLVAFFGSEGLYCYDMEGKLLWKRDLGILDSGFFRVPKAQWGFASSPVIHEGVVVVQCDIQKGSFLAAFDVKTGKEIWRTSRDEVPTWGTPTIYVHDRQARIVVNGYKHIGGYDFKTGREVWRMRGGGDIPVPTPVIARGLIFINNAHGRMSPIYAIKPGATGDISLKEDATSNDHIAWSVKRGGSYMQTLLVVGEYLYNLRGNGALFCFRAETGEVVYRERVGEGASFSASPVAADGKLYLASENGNIYVVPSGPAFKLLATNPMGEICMATPAISRGVLFFRTHRRLVAVSGE